MKFLKILIIAIFPVLAVAQIQLGTNFQVNTALPVDTRMTVADTTARNNIPALVRYEGLITYVEADDTHYALIGGIDNVNWQELGTGSGGGDGNLQKWESGQNYVAEESTVWEPLSLKIYKANTTHTSAATFAEDEANWDELSNPFTATNLAVSGNTISSTDTDGNIIFAPDGAGEVQISGFAGGLLLESTATGGLSESTATTADIEGKLEKFPTETNDNRIVRTDVDGNAVQGSGVTLDDSDAMSGLTEFTVDNLNLNGNTLSSTSGNVILNPFADLNIDGVTANQVPYANASGAVVGISSFLYDGAADKLRAGGLDFEANAIIPYTTNANLGISANGTGVVNVTSETNIENLNFSGSSITGTSGAEDLTLTAEATRDVKIEDLFYKNSEIFSTAAAPITITPESTQPVNIDDVDIQDNSISASVTNDDLELAGDGDGRVKIDRGGTLYEAGSRNPEYKELLSDPSFEVGVAEWTCTAGASVTQTSTAANVTEGGAAAQIDFTSDGACCSLTTAVSGGETESEYLAKISLQTSDSTVGVSFLDGAGELGNPDIRATGKYERYGQTFDEPNTSLETKVCGDTGNQAFADAAGHTLGGLQRAELVSKEYLVRAAGNAGEAITANTEDVPFIEIEDKYGLWDGDSFTAPEEGEYLVEGSIYVTSGTTLVIKTYIDGSVNKRVGRIDSSTWNTLNGAVHLEKGEVLSLRIDSGATLNNNSELHHLHIQKIPEPSEHVITPANQSVTETKTLNSNLSDTTQDVTDLQFENLVVGNTYFLSGVVYFTSLDEPPRLEYRDSSGGTGTEYGASVFSVDGSSTAAGAYSPGLIFTATSSTMYARFVGPGNLIGNGSRSRTFLQLTNLTSAFIAGLPKPRRTYGEEELVGYDNGEAVYEYCNEVATDITTSTTVETISSGLRPVESANGTGTQWVLLQEAVGSDEAQLYYDSADGGIKTVVFGTSPKIGENTVYCMKYRKP